MYILHHLSQSDRPQYPVKFEGRAYESGYSLRRPYASGAKRHEHRMSGPSMRRRTMRDIQAVRDAVDIGEFVKVSSVRGKLRWVCDDESIRRDYRRAKSKSWKDQSKARRQYARHKVNGGRNNVEAMNNSSIWADLAADGFPVSAGSLENCA